MTEIRRVEAAVIPVADRSNERARFEATIRPLMAPLLAYFARRVTAPEDAADCLSEVLTVLWRRRRDLPDTEERARQWAYGIARGVLANAIRSKVRRTALIDRVRGGITETVDGPSGDGLDVRRAIAQLAEHDQELVRLVIWDGFGVAEAGALLGLRPDAARSRYARARARLKDLLQ